jgi:signal transduction histidine kinase
MYNAACLDLLDTNGSIKGKNIGELFNLTNSDKETENLFEVLQKTKKATRRDDLNHSYTDGESIRLEFTFAPIRGTYSSNKSDEEQGGYIIIARDVTKQKSLEEERDEFIGVVSHELRTPITIVEGTLSNIDVLIQRNQTPEPAVLASSIKTAHDQVLYLAKMVNDLSTLSRAERGVGDTTEEIDVSTLLHTLHHRYQDEAQTRKLHLDIDLGTRLGTVNVSRLYLEELLQNFITNALKYTKEGSVTISAHRTKDTVKFTVKDTGIGMSRGDQAKIFNKFYRSEDYRIRETSGTGLGLYVSTKLAHKLHTKIELKSRLNHGSSFSFELPTN